MRNVRIKYSLLIFVCLVISCNSSKEKKQSPADSTKSAVGITEKKPIRIFPYIKSIATFDTTISNGQLRITITKTDLDSYVTRESEQQIDKYRDSEISLVIKFKDQILLDTIFRKEQFSKYADAGLIDIAVFHNYWLKKVDKNRIEFFGTISEPETDWAFDFNHYFDLTNQILELVEQKDDQG
jgi:hypothetical protein